MLPENNKGIIFHLGGELLMEWYGDLIYVDDQVLFLKVYVMELLHFFCFGKNKEHETEATR